MKTEEISAIASAVVMTIGLLWYAWQVVRRQIKTVVASWIVSTVALSLSLLTYICSPGANWLGGALNAGSVLATGISLIAVVVTAEIYRELIEFTTFQKKCMYASACIVILWLVIMWGMNGTGVIPNLCTQVLLVISYVMLIKKFWYADRNTESLFTWWCVLLASVIGLYTAYKKADGLALTYALRSTVMCGALVFTLYRLERRQL